MYHIFIHPSTDGHLGCFHVLAVVNSAAVNTGAHVSLRFFSGYMPRCEIAGSYGSSLYSFQGTSLLFSTVAVPIYIPTLNASLDTSVYDS